jgi:hypothetical protein
MTADAIRARAAKVLRVDYERLTVRTIAPCFIRILIPVETSYLLLDAVSTDLREHLPMYVDISVELERLT